MEPIQISIKETRNNLADIVERVALTGQTYIVTKFGKVKAKIVPPEDKESKKKPAIKLKDYSHQQWLKDTFGMWKDRKDMKDPVAWVNKIRKPRYEKIFD